MGKRLLIFFLIILSSTSTTQGFEIQPLSEGERWTLTSEGAFYEEVVTDRITVLDNFRTTEIQTTREFPGLLPHTFEIPIHENDIDKIAVKLEQYYFSCEMTVTQLGGIPIGYPDQTPIEIELTISIQYTVSLMYARKSI